MKIIYFFHPHYHSKVIEDILKNVQKITESVLTRCYGKWQWKLGQKWNIGHIDIKEIDLGLDMDTDILNAKLPQYNDGCMY